MGLTVPRFAKNLADFPCTVGMDIHILMVAEVEGMRERALGGR